MKTLKIITLLAVSIFLISFTAQAQERDIEVLGIVADIETMYPIKGAYVFIQGTTEGTQTDEQGRFEITVKASDTLVVSYPGYITTSMPINSQAGPSDRFVFLLVPESLQSESGAKFSTKYPPTDPKQKTSYGFNYKKKD